MIQITLFLLVTAILSYIIISGVEFGYDYSSDIIKKKYNLFTQIKRFFDWLDSKPKIIKPSKKNWRSPDNWNNEI